MTNVADHRDLGAFIPAVLDDYPLDPFEFRVYARIVRRAGGPRGHDESAANVAKAIGCGARKVREAYDLLTAAKLVHRTKRPGRSDRYTLRPSSDWVSPTQVAELRAQAGRRHDTPTPPVENPGEENPTAVPRTEVPGTAVPEDGQVGPTDRATAVPGTDEGTPVRSSQKDHHHPRDVDTDAAVDNGDDGGGGSATADDLLSPALVAIADRLDPVRRRRLLTEPAGQRTGLDITLAARLEDGWSIEDLADQLTDGSLDEVGSIAGVLRGRAQRLAGAEPPSYRRRDADGIPHDVLDELAKRAADDAVLADGSVDHDLRRRRLDDLAGAWLSEHQAQEVGAR